MYIIVLIIDKLYRNTIGNVYFSIIDNNGMLVQIDITSAQH